MNEIRAVKLHCCTLFGACIDSKQMLTSIPFFEENSFTISI